MYNAFGSFGKGAQTRRRLGDGGGGGSFEGRVGKMSGKGYYGLGGNWTA